MNDTLLSLPVQTWLRDGGSLERLQTELGVYSKRHPKYPNLVQLTYDMIEAPKGHPIVEDCRGLILDSENNWNIVALPFKRFYNYAEGHAAKIDWSTARIQEKVDGSLCIVYFYDNKWHVATRGMPDAGGEVNGHNFTFAELFWKIADKAGITDYLNYHSYNYTFLFELTSLYNKVVVSYPNSSLTFLTSRNINTGKEIASDVDEVLNPVKEYKFTSQEEVIEFANTLDGREHEGFVVVDATSRRIKIKSENYLALAHLRDGFGPRRVLEVIRTGEGSEVSSYTDSFPEWKPLFEEVSKKYEELVLELETEYERIKHIQEQKAFALEALKTKMSGALFQVRSGRFSSMRKYLAAINIKNLMETLKVRDIVIGAQE